MFKMEEKFMLESLLPWTSGLYFSSSICDCGTCTPLMFLNFVLPEHTQNQAYLKFGHGKLGPLSK